MPQHDHDPSDAFDPPHGSRDDPQNTALTSAKFTNRRVMKFVFEFVNKTYMLIKLSVTFIFPFQSSHGSFYVVFISFKFPLLLYTLKQELYSLWKVE